ncbi:MAG: DUF2318 domain-containing protein [Chloroflexi bacterium]|nr:DUF2318 domain-containing protein [Chloroflexota bacterium]
MVEAMVVTLREGIEAALILGIILAYLGKAGRSHLKRWVYGGLGLAVLGSVALAAVIQAIAFDSEVLEGPFMLVAALFVGSMVVWMWRTSGNVRGEIEGRLDTVVSAPTAGGGWPLLVLTFFLILREGAETVIFVAALAAGQSPVLALAGALMGLGLAVLFGWLLLRGSMRVDLKRFFTVTSVVLLALVVKLIAGALHEMAEQEWVPMTRDVMNFLGYFVRDDSSLLILLALLVLPVLVILLDWRRAGPAQAEGESAAERRKRLAAAQHDRNARVALLAATLAIVLGMSAVSLASSKPVDPRPEPVQVSGDTVRLSLAEMEEDTLHKFVVTIKGTDVRFLAVKLKDGYVAAALDACNICGPVGFMQEGENAICKNCQAPIAMNTLHLGGGCNPIPLASTREGDSLVIPLKALEAGQPIFGKGN